MREKKNYKKRCRTYLVQHIVSVLCSPARHTNFPLCIIRMWRWCRWWWKNLLLLEQVFFVSLRIFVATFLSRFSLFVSLHFFVFYFFFLPLVKVKKRVNYLMSLFFLFILLHSLLCKTFRKWLVFVCSNYLLNVSR